MKLVTAVINPFQLDDVCAALETGGVRGITLTELAGIREPSPVPMERDAVKPTATVPLVRLDIAVPDRLAQGIASTILESTQGGHFGTGRVFLADLIRVVRVRDGARDLAAL